MWSATVKEYLLKTSVVALCPVTVGFNLSTSRAELGSLGLTPGSSTTLPADRMELIRLSLQRTRGRLPFPRGGGGVANTADLLARAGVSCGIIGVGGKDTFGKDYVVSCGRSSLLFLSALVNGAKTGYDIYLVDEYGTRTIIATPGANSLLSPALLNIGALQNSDLILLDGALLSYGPESEAAVLHCAKVAETANVPFVLALESIEIVESYRSYFDVLSPRAQMVVGNLEQVAVLVGLPPSTLLESVRDKLRKTSINAIITLDVEGAFARFGKEEYLVHTQELDAVDSTGAGDAFLAGFLLARGKGYSAQKALTVGNLVSREVIQHDSARLPENVDVPLILKEKFRIIESMDI